MKRLITGSFLFIMFFMLSLHAAQKLAEPVKDKVYLVTVDPDDMMIGFEDAPVTIISYTSLTCSHCAEFHNKTIPALYDAYIRTGKLRVILRYFPLDKISLYASVMVEQASKDQRIQRLNLLFEKQDEWLFNSQSPNKLASLCGVSLEEFKTCVEDKDNQSPILQQWLTAKHQFDVEATPSFIIQGKLYEGLLSVEEFQALIEKSLSEHTSQKPNVKISL